MPTEVLVPVPGSHRSPATNPACTSTVDAVFTDVEAFQESMAASGLPPLRSRQLGAAEFQARVRKRDLGPLTMIELATPGGECFRNPRDIRDDDEALWQIDLVTEGLARVEQAGRAADLGPADLVLVDPARPVRVFSTACTHVTMLVPRNELRLRPADAARLAGLRIDGSRGPGALVSSLARDMARSLTGFRTGEADRSAAAVTELIAVALGARLGDERPAPDQALRERVLGFVEARLSERDLGPAAIASAHHISVRRLHKLFEDQPLTVAALIRQRRLERCRADLASSGRTVSAVAARWGFADAAHFSRLFKKTYGYNASALADSSRTRTVKASAAQSREDGGAPRTER